MRLIIKIFLLLLLISTTAHSAVTCMLQTGKGDSTGGSWTNAAGISQLTTYDTRGDTLWLGDGDGEDGLAMYPPTVWQAGTSGANYVYVFKATESSHGPEAGWDSSYGDGQAIFYTTNNAYCCWRPQTSYWEFDGVTGSDSTNYGIVVWYNNYGADQYCMYAINGYTVNYMKFHHIEFRSYQSQSALGHRGGGIFSNQVGGRTDWDISNCYFNNGGQFWISLGSGNHVNTTIHDNWFKNCGSGNSSYHCAGIIWYGTNALNMQIYNNWFENMLWAVGVTSYMEPQGQGGSDTDIYNNIFIATSDSETTGLSVISLTSTDYGSFNFFNNVIYGLHGACGITTNDSTGLIQSYNNIWHGNSDTTPSFTDVDVNDYNAFDADNSQANQQILGDSPFTNAAGGDFTLVTGSEPINNGTNLSAYFTLDRAGNTFGEDGDWDIGAYEFQSEAPTGGIIPIIIYHIRRMFR